MTESPPAPYTTNLSKAQGLVPETLELLALWQPGMSAADLKSLVKQTGALGRATDTRITDVVSRGFAQRDLIDGGRPATWLKQLVDTGVNRSALHQIIFVYTARHNSVFHDFVTDVFWRKALSDSGEVTKEDTRDFLERATACGRIVPRWADMCGADESCLCPIDELPVALTVTLIIPRCHGGKVIADNLRTVCITCADGLTQLRREV